MAVGVITERDYLEQVKRSPDVRLIQCSWCPPYKAPKFCSQVMGFLPGGGSRCAGWGCDPCIGKYRLSYLKEPGSGPMNVARGGKG